MELEGRWIQMEQEGEDESHRKECLGAVHWTMPKNEPVVVVAGVLGAAVPAGLPPPEFGLAAF
jgi:hypothetical protein